MRALKFIWVGKLRERFFQDAADHYLKKIKRSAPYDEVVVKDGPGKLPPDKRTAAESEDILKRIDPKDFVVCLDEHGKKPGSRALAKQMQKWLEMPGRTPTFIIGGPFGMSPELKKRADMTLALSDMTLPHELCRVLLLEQIYRAFSILSGSPYHHD